MRRLQKLSDLEPCMNPSCRGPLTRGFVVLHMSHGLLNAQAVNEVLGMHQFFGGRASMQLVENFAPSADQAVLVFGDKDPNLYVTVILCQVCWLDADFNLAHLWDLAERRGRAREDETAKGASL
jgi:hypothetical protein